MSSWPSTQAELVHLELTTNSDSNDSPSYKVQARYRYQVDGVYYSNDRVAISIFDADFYPVELSNNLKASFDAKSPLLSGITSITQQIPLLIEHSDSKLF